MQHHLRHKKDLAVLHKRVTGRVKFAQYSMFNKGSPYALSFNLPLFSL